MDAVPDDLRPVLDRVREGSSSGADLDLLREAVRDGRLVAATGDRAVAVGGHADGAVFQTGDGNVALNLSPDRDAAVLARLFPPRLYQLPADLDDFVGREREIGQVLGRMRAGAGQAVISAFAGLGGVGKTALAVHVAHKLKDDYPEGQIVVDMQGTGDRPLEPAEAMARVIYAFQPEARLPDDLRELTPIYHATLRGRRVLLLLDNARDAAQVRPLQPNPPCGMIITSRRTIALPGLEPLNLEKMSQRDANELLKETAGRGRTNGDERKRIAELCGWLPLALRVAGMSLRVHPDRPVDEYIEALSDERQRLRHLKLGDDEQLDVEVVLGLSARQLVREDAQLAARWQMLSVFPFDFDREAAAAVWAVPEAEAQSGLEFLLERALLLYTKKTGRYRLHDLMRPVARDAFSYADASDPEADQTRLAEAEAQHAAHYRDVLARAKRLYKEGGQAIRRGLALYEAESQNIRAGQAWAAEHATDDDRAAALCSDYPDAGVYVFYLRLHPRERIGWLEAAVAAAQRLGARPAEARHLGHLGLAYADLGQPRRAMQFHRQSLAMDREMGHRRGEGSSLGSLGSAYVVLGQPGRAIEFFEQHLEIAREIGDRRGEGTALGNLGLAYADLREPRRAIEFHQQALGISREIGDRRGEGADLGNLGIAYRDLGEPRRAIEFYEQHLKIAREIGDRGGESNALCNLGVAYKDLGEPRRAIKFHERALAISREIGDRRGQGNRLGNLGIAYEDLGEPRRAIEFYEQALAIHREMGDRRGEGTDLWNMSLALDALGQRSEAIGRAEAALEIYEEIEDPYVEEVRRQLAQWHGQSGPSE